MSCGPAELYLDPDAPLEDRVEDLVSRMTLEEKVSQLLYDAPAIERLGIPEYNWWNEALHGVARAGRATVFPQAIGLAATWDTDLLLDVASTISDEARAKHHDAARKNRRGIYEGLTFWSPNINIFRDPRWGRGMETYGEDPYLTGELAVQFVRGLQGDDSFYLKTVATPKHFAVHSGPEPDRHVFDASVSEYDLRETYLPAFRATIVDGNAQSIMCAYNRFRGDACCANSELLQTILREEWSFEGYVVSDCWAIMDIYNTHKLVETPAEAAAISLTNGTDLNCGVTYRSLIEAISEGLVDEAQIDESVRRLFRARFRLGMFDPSDRVPYSSIPFDVVESEAHQELALEAARKSIVLLKNDGLLPLSKELSTIAVIGPNANEVEVLLGNYNGYPTKPVTPLEGIRNSVSGNTRVLYSRGTDWAAQMPSLTVVPTTALHAERNNAELGGLSAEYFSETSEAESPAIERIDSTIDFAWFDGIPKLENGADSFSVVWNGFVEVPASGGYTLGLKALGEARLFVNDSLAVELSNSHEISAAWDSFQLEEDREYPIRIEFAGRRTNSAIQLVWQVPEPRLQEDALELANQAEVVIMVMGLSPRLEGEEMRVDVPGFGGGDRLDIGLPESQENLIKAIHELGKPIVLVLLNGSAIGVNWAADNTPAIVEAWYPGQAAGSAIADVIFGDYNPAGRLPITFYKSVDQLPPFSDYNMAGRTYRYFEGEPLFPFGHGLSYSRFEYENLDVPNIVSPENEFQVSVDVRNTSAVPGEEVVQLYLTDLEASAPVPIRSLQGFTRVFLEPGELRTISFSVISDQLSLIDEYDERVIEPGLFELSVGGKQPGFSGIADASTTGVVSRRFSVQR